MTSLTRTCPDRGFATPAMALIRLLLPAPERPNTPTTGASTQNFTCSAKSPSVCSMSMSIIGRPVLASRREPLGGHQRQDRQNHGDKAQPQRLRVGAGYLRERVDRQRKRFGLARNVGHERDRRAEFTQATSERKQHTGDDARQREWQSDRREHPRARGPERPRRRLEARVDGVD